MSLGKKAYLQALKIKLIALFNKKMKKYLASVIVLFFVNLSFSQNKKDVLLTVDGKPVYTEEFKRVYSKNLDLVKDESQKNVDGYLDLFIDYKIKVAEAYAQNLDKDKTYISEFNQYRDQLSRNYIFENKVTSELTLEAYNRGLDEINANHILIFSKYDDIPQDTLKAYNQIKAIYDRAKAGEDFVTLAKENSEEPNANKSGGTLGYFTAFAMVYPFETAAYNTKVGDVSEIVRTQFGYHIIKINDRRERGSQITTSHIMLSDKGDNRTFVPEDRIKELYTLLQQGEDFAKLAEQYSDDKNSAKNGGQLQKFRRGELRAPEFEKAAFSLESAGDFSKPVKSQFGWHIIKLDEKHDIATFEEEKESLEKKVKNGVRSKIVTSALNDQIKEKYGYNKITDYGPFFNIYVSDDILKKKWGYDTIASAQDRVIFTIGKKEVRFSDFAKFIVLRQKQQFTATEKSHVLSDFYYEFETDELKNYFIDNLEFENDQYAATISEYRNGLLIFDVMNKNIWMKAKNDTIGLQKYYETVKGDYLWNDRVDAVILTSTSEKSAIEARELLINGKNNEEIKEALNVDDKVNVIISEGVFEKGQRELPESFEMKEGVSQIYSNKDAFTIVRVNKIMLTDIKPLDAVKGKVMSDYQNNLESKWMKGLRDKYKVQIHKKALKRVKKELES
ncbi:MAG: peptidyl-prolyl cis-trans isomerase SurA [Sediminicola sp.]